MKRVVIVICALFACNASAYMLESTQHTEDKIKRYLVQTRAAEDAFRYDLLCTELTRIQNAVLDFDARKPETKTLITSVDGLVGIGMQCLDSEYYNEATLVVDFCLQLLDCAELVENGAALRYTEFNDKFDHAVRQAGLCFGKLLLLIFEGKLPLEHNTLDINKAIGMLEDEWGPLFECEQHRVVELFGQDKVIRGQLAYAVREFLLNALSVPGTVHGILHLKIVQKGTL